jgi:hypothetical protein
MGSGAINTGQAQLLLEVAAVTPSPSYRKIKLTQRQWALVDADDFDWLNRRKWMARWNKSTRTFYAITNSEPVDGKRFTILMHREILGLQKGDPRKGDHRNPSRTLDNRSKNLRIATVGQQNCNQRKRKDNTTGTKGIFFVKKLRKWISYIGAGGKFIVTGYHTTKTAAIKARKQAVEIYHGEFGRQE